MSDWLTEGGQTIDMRTLWVSHVSLLVVVKPTTLIVDVDHDDRATVHQGKHLGRSV